VRFIGALVNAGVVAAESFVLMLNQFLDLVDIKSVDDLTRSSADYFVYTVLSVLPWTANGLSRYDLNTLITRVDEYMNRRVKRESQLYRIYITPASTPSSTSTTAAPGSDEGKTENKDDATPEPYDVLNNLWVIIQSMHKDILKEEWKNPGIPFTPYACPTVCG
jgi:hypothetical protein